MLTGEWLSISEWQTLLAVQAGSAATLTGLVFVAVSINIDRIITGAGLPARAAESLFQFLQVFFICKAALIPRQPMAALAIETFCIALLSCIVQTVGQIRYAKSRSGHPRSWLVSRILQTQVGAIPFFAGAGYLLFGLPSGMYWLVAGFVLSFCAGVASAWVLLIEILR
jgi:hypothetical protein